MKKILHKKLIYLLPAAGIAAGLMLYFHFRIGGQPVSSATDATATTENIQLQRYIINTMSTSAELTIYGTPEQGKLAVQILEQCFQNLNSVANRFDAASEISRFNASFPGCFNASPMFFDLMEKSVAAGKISDGCFDVTVSPLLELWGFYRQTPERCPTPEELNSALEKCGFEKIVFFPEHRQLRLTVPGLKIDLGGIAKGYAVDLAVAELQKQGLTRALLNLSGNLRGTGTMPPGKLFYRVAIRNPFDRNGVCGELPITGEAISSSGNYERYRIVEGKYYTHIIDPRSGMPVENTLSVTVVAPDATQADYLSTAIFVGGPALAEKITALNPKIGVIIYQSYPGNPDEAFGRPFGQLPPGSSFQKKIKRPIATNVGNQP